MKNIEFFAFDSEKHCLMNIGLEINPYPNTKEGLEMNNTYRQGVRWNNNEQIIVLEDNYSVTGYPTEKMDGVVAIYGLNSKKFPAPNNAAIFNADGSFRLQLEVPEEMLSTNAQRMKPNKSECYFQQAGWSINSKGEKVTHVWICFAKGEYYEVRALNTQIGEIGELLTFGRM
jgi:hypothetical protein